ncbi:uncharacterized protein LOC122247471 [Penaeus japonicus]|uniref:uncharacterized protein LOC122247471 n=1 Tax=Penaeus japonicus TaxID=27405 RepID=UPI001C70FC33|nr:uncharacterized protein LOC122247471 [Penaeus japonicus]
MISVILQVGAVPFGQAIEMGNSDVRCCGLGNYTSSTVEWQNLRLGASLPEMMLSEAPPPSPLRRAHSHHFLFPCEAEKGGVSPGPVTPTLPQPTASPTPVHTAPPTSSETRPDEGASSDCSKRLQETRARFEAFESRDQASRECHERLHESVQSVGCLQGEARAAEEREGTKTWRRMGSDLRKIADQFHVDHAKTNTDKSRYCIILPASFAHGFAASLICLISWRFLSKLC